MGISTDAILFYGYCWSEDTTLLPYVADSDPGDDEWAEVIARRRGVVNPWDSYAKPELPYRQQQAAGEAWIAAHRAEVDAWHKALAAIETEFKVGIDWHGAGEFRCPFIYAQDLIRRAGRACPEVITIGDLAGRSLTLADALLARFVQELDIDVFEAKGPAWFLVSWWG